MSENVLVTLEGKITHIEESFGVVYVTVEQGEYYAVLFSMFAPDTLGIKESKGLTLSFEWDDKKGRVVSAKLVPNSI